MQFVIVSFDVSVVFSVELYNVWWSVGLFYIANGLLFYYLAVIKLLTLSYGDLQFVIVFMWFWELCLVWICIMYDEVLVWFTELVACCFDWRKCWRSSRRRVIEWRDWVSTVRDRGSSPVFTVASSKYGITEWGHSSISLMNTMGLFVGFIFTKLNRYLFLEV